MRATVPGDSPSSSRRLTRLDELPADLLGVVLRHSEPQDALLLAQTCRALRACADADEVWRRFLLIRHASVLKSFFAGTSPPPAAGASWKWHFLTFDEAWLGLAQRRSGRMLLRMRTECELSCPCFYGVPWHAGAATARLHAVYT